MNVVQHRLANGLLVNLIQDSGASHAAALVQLSAGSHHEPDAWPGLAHLLEHVLFAGSEGYQKEARLMAWAPARGGRLNATTRAASTAWFVEVAAPDLADATARLADMLQRPLLAAESVRQEAAAIEAEYRMLAAHRETLCEAALSRAFAQPHPLHRFQVGSQAHFGQDLPALSQALREYHQRFFHAKRLMLWLQGPQPLEELLLLAEHWGGRFPEAPPVISSKTAAGSQPAECSPRLVLRPERGFRLQMSGEERLQLSFLIASPAPGTFGLLQELLLDAARHSLLDTLREQGLCDEIDLLETYRSDQQSIISVVFHLCAASATNNNDTNASSAVTRPAAVEAIFCRWLELLTNLPQEQLRHYAALSCRRFTHLSSLDRLRTRAFGFTPADEQILAPSGEWQHLLNQLQPGNMTRLWVSPEAVADKITAQGFTLNLIADRWPAGQASVPDKPALVFSSATPPAPPSLPQERVALRHVPSSAQATLLLSPLPGELSASQAAWVEASLQPLSGICHHQGGELAFERLQGSWLLRLSCEPDLMLSVINEVNNTLCAPAPADIARGERLALRTAQRQVADIAVRCLQALLPEAITCRLALRDASSSDGTPGRAVRAEEEVLQPENKPEQVRWEATLYGGDRALCQALSCLLSRFPGDIIDSASRLPEPQRNRPFSASICSSEQQVSASPSGSICSSDAHLFASEETPFLHPFYRCPTESPDAAVILFCPLVEQTAACLAAWQLFGALLEPRFFQRLRVEKNVGYVVSCRFQQSAGTAGVLFALQSPSLSAGALYGCITDFIAGMQEVIHSIPAEAIQEKVRTLRLGEADFPASPAAILKEWQTNQLRLPPLTLAEVNGLTPARLNDYYRRLAADSGRWIGLTNQ